MTQKSVHFGEVSERFIPDLQLTQAERASLWFTKDDIKSFRQDHRTTTTTNEPCQVDDYVSCCTASISRPSSSRTRRRSYVSYVLQLQENNRSNEIQDATGLRALAVAMSANSVEQARFRAERNVWELLQQRCCQSYTGMAARKAEPESKLSGYSSLGPRCRIQDPKRKNAAATMA